ncbi:rod shape-determining protein RodA [Erythrobacter litoralis]|uniref:rod shape-determining protein RodA n=1 Tax=Erythrobacter litoralis TaxID=39960 RepID=UPI00243485B1|nr:rod shape-determining protein RodA [Erythrobacter litoralis]MDG6079571.1 rod shape-determining protein RodA [Erythrobacter litoralis]
MSGIVPAPVARQPWRLLFPLFALIGFGALVLYSAAGGSMDPYADSHLLRFAIFFVMAVVISRFNRGLVTFMAFPAYTIILILLLAVELAGQIGGGSQRWLEVGPIRIQPSELMKPAVVLALARYYDNLPVGMVPTWKALVPAGLIIALPMAFVLLQPDLGTSLAIAFGGGLVMLFAGLPLRWFIGAGLAGAAAIPLAFFFALQPYQQSRVTTFLDPESDPLGEGYQITQSKIAIGSGGLFGKGFNEGSQSHLNYLPEPHTDFVFATMAEEWGLMGGLFVIIAFALILNWGMSVARASDDRFAKLAAAGMTATIFFFIAINLMMVMGLAPVVGIPLPFMSHGGSSMMTNMICIGILMMIDRWTRKAPRTGRFAS